MQISNENNHDDRHDNRSGNNSKSNSRQHLQTVQVGSGMTSQTLNLHLTVAVYICVRLQDLASTWVRVYMKCAVSVHACVYIE